MRFAPNCNTSPSLAGPVGSSYEDYSVMKDTEEKQRKFCFIAGRARIEKGWHAALDTTLPTLQELCLSRVNTRAGKITLDPHIQHTPSLNCYRLVNATEPNKA